MRTVEDPSSLAETTVAGPGCRRLRGPGQGARGAAAEGDVEDGISTVAAYTGARSEALGLSQQLVDTYFTGTAYRSAASGWTYCTVEVEQRHARAYPAVAAPPEHRTPDIGEYQWRRDGEIHLFDPETVFLVALDSIESPRPAFRDYTRRVDEQSERLLTPRGLFRLLEGVQELTDIDEVEPVSDIVRRFSTGAMSYGSISIEAHETRRSR